MHIRLQLLMLLGLQMGLDGIGYFLKGLLAFFGAIPHLNDIVTAVVLYNGTGLTSGQRLNGLRQRLDQIFVVDAEQHHLRMRRVRQRTEDVEDRADAELFADRADVFHRCMIFLREHEADVDFLEELDAFFWREVEVDAERFEAVGRAAL